MRIQVGFAVMVVSLAPFSAAEEKDNQGLRFVSEYIRELSALDEIRASSVQHLSKDSPKELALDIINGSERFQLELSGDIASLNEFHFSGDRLDKLVPAITDIYRNKAGLWHQIGEIYSQTLVQTESSELAKQVTEIPKLRARVEYLDETLLRLTPAVFSALIDSDHKNQSQPAHLTITKVQRTDLLKTLRSEFGAKLDAKEQSYEVSIAILLKGYLLKYKCTDELTYK